MKSKFRLAATFGLALSIAASAMAAQSADSPLDPDVFQRTEVITDPNLPPDQQPPQPPLGTLNLNRFFLNIDPKRIKKVQKKEKENIHAFDGYSDIKINQNPVLRSIRAQDQITVHPYFTSTLLLPKGSVISFAQGKQLLNLKFSQNMLVFDIDTSFDRGNLVVAYTEKEQNKLLNLIVKRFDASEQKGEALNTIYAYVNEPILSDLEVIQEYVKQNRKFPSKKFNYVYKGDVVYRIVEDAVDGNVFVKGKRYRIGSSVVGK